MRVLLIVRSRFTAQELSELLATVETLGPSAELVCLTDDPGFVTPVAAREYDHVALFLYSDVTAKCLLEDFPKLTELDPERVPEFV